MNWLRLDVSITRDMRLRREPSVTRWAWIGVLVVAARSSPSGRIPTAAAVLAAEAGITPTQAREAINWFLLAGMLKPLDSDWHEVIGWRRALPPSGLLRLPAHLWRVVRAAIFERDDYTCRYCGERGGRLECDHVLPLSRGGTNDPDNLATACRRCNRRKRAKTLSEWTR